MKISTDFDPDLLAWIYDQQIEDWPGEVTFYLEHANESSGTNRRILEIGCGTGRIAVRLAQHGFLVTGLDNSRAMLDRARLKSKGQTNLSWVQADMQHFDLAERFNFAIIPGHSFQFMLNADAQSDCLNCIKAHLQPNAKLIVHVNHDDLKWLANLRRDSGPRFEPAGDIRLPENDHILRQLRAWSYERVTQTATSINLREELDDSGEVINSWRSDPIQLHCVFPTEIQHLASRVDLSIDAIYGDFAKSNFVDDSPQIIIVFRNI